MSGNHAHALLPLTLISLMIIPSPVHAAGDSNEINLDLIGIILSIIIPIIAIFFGWYYSTRKRRNIEKLIDDMSKINNLLDLYAWFELISSDGVLKGQINHAQFELIQGHYKLHQNRLKNQRPSAVAINQDSIIQTAQTSAIDPEVAEKLEAYVQMLVRGGYPEEQARVHALNHIASFE
tara:strand:- start:185 stop:721 length:537 start_codon:yes stop_codon:yes gene_type:complete